MAAVGRTPTCRLMLLAVEEAGAEREAYELGAVLQAQLVHDAGAICIYAFRAEMQQLADFGRGVTLRGETQDFAVRIARVMFSAGLPLLTKPLAPAASASSSLSSWR